MQFRTENIFTKTHRYNPGHFALYIPIFLYLLIFPVNNSLAQDTNIGLIARFGVGEVNSLVWSPDGGHVILGTATGIHIMDSATLEVGNLLEAYGNNILSVALSPNSMMIASGGENKLLELWSTQDGSRISALEGHEDAVSSVAFSPDGSMVASASNDGTVRLWDISEKRCVAALEGHKDRVKSVAFSPDGQILASGSIDKTIKFWDWLNGECINTFKAEGEVNCIAFSPDGTMMASGTTDGYMKLWWLSSNQDIIRIFGNYDGVKSLSFSPDSLRLVSSGGDGTVKLWSVPGIKYFKDLERS